MRTPRGEVDLLVAGPTGRLVVEVKACVGAGTPLDRVDDTKAERLWAMAHQLGATGVLLVEVRLTGWGATLGWSPG